MCHWLTIAVRGRDALSPLREFGLSCEPAEHPMLPVGAETKQRWLVAGSELPAGRADPRPR